ncbi:hypothetical protein JL101_035970 (plasmid) [Skermanella rosea]|uniref:hypothetical protein n=1 Tax=Skermanella rosea TaxID=1817965 RepID=UPI001931B47C|nr:hypothetical protein [Skermanella rosea]UEM08051.1 hypothetical protein JL101_035970 [Skermanella rosea]
MSRLLTLLGGEFQPTDVPGLALWLDATDPGSLSVSSNLVSQWRDKSGRGNNAAQGTTLRQPRLVASAINGRPALRGRHDGTNASQLTIPDVPTLNYTAFSVFSVIQRVADLGAAETIAGKYTVTGNQREFWNQINAVDQASTTISTDGTSTAIQTAAVSSPMVPVGAPAVIEAHYNNSQIITVMNGSLVSASANPTIFNGTGNYTLFARADLVDPLAGDIGEHLFYTRALSLPARQAITAYLRAKWGIA